MLLKFIIATNFLLLAIAATIGNNETTSKEDTDYDESELSFTDDSYSRMVGVIDAFSAENITEEWSAGDNATTTERPTCKSDEWQCADFSCVRLEYKCDGALHCEDGSDETRANCNGTQRPMLGLLMYCIADRTHLKDGVCPDICKFQPEYCAYALLTEHVPPGVCAIPDFIRNGNYKITKLNTTSEYNNNDFSLKFECEIGTELVGEPNVACVNGTWNSDFPYCSDTCKLKENAEYTYTCKRGEMIKSCGDYVAIGTEVTVEKQDKKISNSSITVHTICTERRVLNVSNACVEEVETVQDTLENNVMNELSEFENKFKETEQLSFDFQKLVRNYRSFEEQVSGNTRDLSLKIAMCDINLDLMNTSS